MVDTENAIVTVPRGAAAAVRPARWAMALAAVGVVVPVGVLAASLLPSRAVPGITRPYALVPSSALRVAPRISVDAQRYESAGEFYFVTVREPALDALTWWVGRDELPIVYPLTPEEKHGTRTPSQESYHNRLLMTGAKNTAQAVALRRLDYEVGRQQGPVVIDHFCLVFDSAGTCTMRSPADEVLDPDDHIVAVDGVAVGVVDDLAAALAGKVPGDVVTLAVDRAGVGTFDVEVTLIAAPGDPDRTIIGFVPFDTSTVVLPFDVAIDTDTIGGPSAGLAFTLTLVDELTPGDLTGGLAVAVTGTIGADGSVGAIGGLVQKTEAVRQAGADVFLVPTAQGDEEIAAARAVAGDALEVIPVATFDEAIDALVARGGSGVPPAPAEG